MLNRALLLVGLLLTTAGLVTCQQQRVSRANEARDTALAAQAAAEAAQADAERSLALAASTTHVVTEYVDRVHVVRERGTTLIKEVPVYVSAKADAACVVPVGFVRLHDAAASEHAASGPAGDTDAPAADATLAGIAGTVAANYADYHAAAAQVEALQALARKLHAALQECSAS